MKYIIRKILISIIFGFIIIGLSCKSCIGASGFEGTYIVDMQEFYGRNSWIKL